MERTTKIWTATLVVMLVSTFGFDVYEYGQVHADTTTTKSASNTPHALAVHKATNPVLENVLEAAKHDKRGPFMRWDPRHTDEVDIGFLQNGKLQVAAVPESKVQFEPIAGKQGYVQFENGIAMVFLPQSYFSK